MRDLDVGARQLAELLALVPEVVILTDTDRRVLYINRPQEGYELDEIVGTDSLEFVAPDFRRSQAELFDRVVETGEPETYEIAITDAGGERQWHEGTLIPLTRDGRVTRVALFTRNVTARHRSEEEMKKLRNLLPICSWCKKIRSDEGYWQEIEAYVEETSGSRVTHGMCAECREEHFGTDPGKSA